MGNIQMGDDESLPDLLENIKARGKRKLGED